MFTCHNLATNYVTVMLSFFYCIFIFMLFFLTQATFPCITSDSILADSLKYPTTHHVLECLCLPPPGRWTASQIQTHIHIYLVHSQMSPCFLCRISSLPATNSNLKPVTW